MDKVQGCCDHNCIFGHPGGMGTNGGCRCLDLHRNPDRRIRAMKNILALRAQLDEARAELAKARTGQILTDKDLLSAVITAVMSGKQAERDEAVRKLQRHILRVEEERDQREAECERWAKGNADLARIIATSNKGEK